MNSSPSTETSIPVDMAARLRVITDLDAEIKDAEDRVKDLKKRRDTIEKLAIEDIVTSGFDGVKFAGRSWRIEWTHSMSATEATKEQIVAAMEAMGIDPAGLTQINTAKLKATCKELAEARGIDSRQSWTEGTPLEGIAGEYIAPRLRFTTTG